MMNKALVDKIMKENNDLELEIEK